MYSPLQVLFALFAIAAGLSPLQTRTGVARRHRHFKAHVGHEGPEPRHPPKDRDKEVRIRLSTERPIQLLFSSSVHDASDAVNAAPNEHRMSVTARVYCLGLCAMIIVVVSMFRHLGMFGCLQIVLYVCCLAFVKIVLKMLFEYDFHYPKFITTCHLFVSGFSGFVVLTHRSIRDGRSIPVPTKSEFFFGVLPIAGTFGFSIANDNSALVYVSVAFAEVIASCNPVMAALLTWALGLPFSFRLLMPVGVVALGCVISVTGEMAFSGIGLAFLLIGIFLRSIKAVLQQKLMTGETKEKFEPVTLMAWTSMCAFLTTLIFSAATEGMAPVNTLLRTSDLFGLLMTLIASCVIACTLNLSGLFVVKQLGAVGMQLTAQLKSILVVIGGLTLLSETFTIMQWLGFGTVLCGVCWYSQVQRAEKEQCNAK